MGLLTLNKFCFPSSLDYLSLKVVFLLQSFLVITVAYENIIFMNCIKLHCINNKNLISLLTNVDSTSLNVFRNSIKKTVLLNKVINKMLHA